MTLSSVSVVVVFRPVAAVGSRLFRFFLIGLLGDDELPTNDDTSSTKSITSFILVIGGGGFSSYVILPDMVSQHYQNLKNRVFEERGKDGCLHVHS